MSEGPKGDGTFRHRARIMALAVAVLILLVAVIPTTQQTTLYGGRKMDGWFKLLVSSSLEERKDAEHAIDAIGRECLPFRSSQVQADKPRAIEQLQSWFRTTVLRRPAIKISGGRTNRNEMRLQGPRLGRAFEILGDRAAPIAPKLAALLSEPHCSSLAALSLASMGTAGLMELDQAFRSNDVKIRRTVVSHVGEGKLDRSNAVSILLKATKDSDASIRKLAASGLGNLRERSGESVPALAALLGDSDAEIRRAAIYSLGEFHLAAAPALPAISKLEDDPVKDIADSAGVLVMELRYLGRAWPWDKAMRKRGQSRNAGDFQEN